MVYIEGKNARNHQVKINFTKIFLKRKNFLLKFKKNLFQNENWKIGKSVELKTQRDGNKNKNTNIRKLSAVKEGDIRNTRYISYTFFVKSQHS